MSKVVNLAEYREKRKEELKEAERQAAIAKIIARCPKWPGDPQ